MMFKASIDDLIAAIEAVKQGVMLGEETTSGLMFSDDFVGKSEIMAGLQKRREKALEYCRKWGGTADEKKCAVCT